MTGTTATLGGAIAPGREVAAELSYLASRYPGGRRVLARDVIDRYDLGRTTLARQLVAQHPVLSLWLVLGDLDLDVLDLDAQADPRIGLPARSAAQIHGLLVTGGLTVRGPVLSSGRPGGLALYVMGELRAANTVLSGVEVLVRGTTRVNDVLCCAGNGQAWFDGDVKARLLVSAGFPLWISGALAAPVLDTPDVRVACLQGGQVEPVTGDVPAGLALTDELLDAAPDRPGDRAARQASIPRLVRALAARRPVLAPAYRAGKIDLNAIRERQWLLRRGESAMREKRYTTAAGLFRAALQRGAPAGATGVRLVDALYRAHQLTGDRAGLREALRLLDTHLARHQAQEREGDHPEADRRDPVERQRELARVLILRASVVLQLDDDDGAFARAQADHDRALGLDPDRHMLSHADLAEAYSLMGRWLYARREYEQSVAMQRRALAEVSDHEQANGTLARALWMLGREVEAIPYATRSLQVNPADDFIWFVRGKCRQRLGDHGQARSDLQTYLDLHPDDEFTAEALVETAFDSHRPELALDLARRFAAGHPEHAEAQARLGRLLKIRGHPREAVPFLRRAMVQGTDGPSVQRASVDLAMALLELGGEDLDGLELAMRTVELATEQEHGPYLRGECYRVLGDLARAESELSEYLREHPDSPAAIASLAMVQLATGRADDAFKLISRAREIAPDDGYVERCAAVLAA